LILSIFSEQEQTIEYSHTHTQTHSILTVIFHVNLGYPVAPLILLLHLFLQYNTIQ